MTFFLYVSVLIIRSRWFQEITCLSSMHKEKKNQARLSSAGNCEADGHLRFFQEALIYQHDHYPYNPNTHSDRPSYSVGLLFEQIILLVPFQEVLGHRETLK